jgi:hypothetical protein
MPPHYHLGLPICSLHHIPRPPLRLLTTSPHRSFVRSTAFAESLLSIRVRMIAASRTMTWFPWRHDRMSVISRTCEANAAAFGTVAHARCPDRRARARGDELDGAAHCSALCMCSCLVEVLACKSRERTCRVRHNFHFRSSDALSQPVRHSHRFSADAKTLCQCFTVMLGNQQMHEYMSLSIFP